MKKTGKILISALAVMLISIAVMFGAVSVSAVYEEQDTNMSVEQMAYNDSYYDDDYYGNPRSVDMGRAIGTSLVVSIIGSVVAVLVVFGRYKFNGRTEPYPYNRKAPLVLTESEDVLVEQYIKTERIERR